jgi:hypothetical protein
MSQILESVLTQEQREACATNDRLLNVVPELLVLSECEQERLRQARQEAEAIQADLARNVNKGERLARQNEEHALDLQVQFQGYIGGLPA